MKNVIKNKFLFTLIFIIGLLSSCSEKEGNGIAEDGKAPTIEFKIAYNGETYLLSSEEDYSQKKLNLPLGKDLSFNVKVFDKGGIDEVDLRIIKFEHEISSYATTPSGWLSSESSQYYYYNYDHPLLGQDIDQFSGDGVWETYANAVLYFMDFDRDFLITAVDRAGYTSEVRIAIERSNEDAVGFHDK